VHKKEVAISIFLLIFSIIVIVPLTNAGSNYTSDDKLKVGVTIDAPILRINVVEDYVNLGHITKGGITNPRSFNITNTGTIDIKIQPLNITSDIFSNLWIGNSNTTGYKRIGNFVGNISQGDREDFWIKLDLRDYTGSITGNLSTNITFFVMPNES
jgi:hypothetical protein